jgi:thymidine phosphorylase
MNEVLGTTAGNALELVEAIAYLRGDGPRESRQHEITLALAAELLVTGGLFATVEAARAACERALSSGEAAERFIRMIVALGGPAGLLEHPGEHLPAAAVVRPALPARAGYVARMDVRAVGLAIVGLGGGRRRAADPIDHAVGLTEAAGIGAAVGPDRPLCLVHARTEADAEAAAAEIRAAVTVAEEPPAPGPVIVERIGA